MSSSPSVFKRIKERFISVYVNLTTSEISGSFGDLGTLLPLLVALSTQRSIQLAPALFFGGISNVITGFVWDVPMCVQPMKSISAVALSENWNAGTVTAAGFLTGGAVFLLGITNLIEVANKIVPGNVVSGLQIGVGVRLASKGLNMVADLGWVDTYDCIILGIVCALLCMYWLREGNSSTNTRPTTTKHTYIRNSSTRNNESIVIGSGNDHDDGIHKSGRTKTWFQKIISFCCKPFISCVNPKKNHPVGVYLFLIGSIFATITLATTKNENNEYDLPLQFFGAPIAYWAMGDIEPEDYWTGFIEGTVPQLPLTTLNSVISVCALAHSLYPEKRKKNAPMSSNDAVISRKEVSISVGLMNLLFCPFGSMPNCHGAGGLAGQHRLGARHGASVLFLGVGKILLAIFFGKSALTLLDAFPTSVLGVMLAIAGQELATTGFTLLVRSVEDKFQNNEDDEDFNLGETDEEILADIAKKKSLLLRQNVVVAVTTAIVIIALGKTHYGASSGWITHLIYGDGIREIKLWYRVRESTSTTMSEDITPTNNHLENNVDDTYESIQNDNEYK
mmetsp:Transcript_3801/g.4981  ORF Transcript_3801/g.4981 Transcript_3801/m.4981 type:complete len:563 (-) Transcript_3801:1896-3584(-)